jgi:hypothetical protein
MFSSIVLSFLAPFAPAAHIGDIHCANTRAAQVDALFQEQGTSTRCGIGISIFGIDISFGGPTCFPQRVRTPAHQVCSGDYNEGTWCGVQGPLPVTEEHCECSDLTLFGTGFKMPDCDCEFAGNVGNVEDFGTFNCVSPYEVGPLPPRGGIGGLR